MEKTANIEDYRKKIKYDGKLPIATGRSRMEKNWKNKVMTWSQLLQKLEKPYLTPETYAEYMKMPKTQQDNIKDVGGFIGGRLKDGRRSAGNVSERQLITLDADFAPVTLLEDLEIQIGFNYAVYSTHKHSREKPRLRLLIPLTRPVTADEYEAVARKIADDIGIDYFDDTTYQASRLMYWPSVSEGGDYTFDYYDQPWLDPDRVLARYPDWTDTSYWPESSRAAERRKRTAKKQGDPCEKKGLIGAFCRTYTMDEAITAFLGDIYEPCAVPGRYTYKEGSTAVGLVLYDDKFAYSNHATDPAGGKLCNAFDLVRIHKYGALDEDALADTLGTKLPSYKAMLDFVQEDKETRLTLSREKKEEALKDFGDGENWISMLEVDKAGFIKNSLKNVRHILQYDERLKGIVFNQMADDLEIKGECLPWDHPGKFWRDADDAQLENYLDIVYAEFSRTKILSAMTKVADDRKYHPVRDYLEKLPKWDGVRRVDTLLIDYFGTEDSEYARKIMRKTLCAAIARVNQPGCKFDYALTLIGPQGIGKSTLVRKLGVHWYSDSLNLADIKDKTAAEKLQGVWLMEIGELAGMGATGTNSLKGFMSRQDDQYRASYGRRTSSHLRQCIFIGTTNKEEGFLRDETGGRRFWPIKTPRIGEKKIWDITDYEIQQIWSEALVYYDAGESLILEADVAEEALRRQKEAIEEDPRQDMVEEYLNSLLPENWYSLSKDDRRDWFHFGKDTAVGVMLRNRVCYQEIWCECFGNLQKNMTSRDRVDIKKIVERIPDWEINEKRQAIKGYSNSTTVYERVQKEMQKEVQIP